MTTNESDLNDAPQIEPINTALQAPHEPLMEPSGAVTLTVARHEDTIAGHVIVTFARKGSLRCQELLSCKSTSELLALAEDKGVDISEPALLATVDDLGHARTVYVTPAPESNFRDFAVWVGKVTETLINLKARNIGFYLCRDSLKADELSDLVGQVIRSLIEQKAADDICLVVGRHAYNEVLSTALNLKHEMDGSSPVHVLH